MGNLAASGGYYIACNANTIFAENNTITGSIGVFGLLPNFTELTSKMGINSEQVSTNANAADYSIFKPFGRFNRMWSDLTFMWENLYAPRKFSSLSFEGSAGITTRKFNTWGINLDGNPIRGNDFFEPRVWGRYFRTYTNSVLYGWYSSDYRKKIALDVGTGYGFYKDNSRFRYNFRFAPRIRLNDHLFLTYVYSYQSHFNDIGFAIFALEDGTLMDRKVGKFLYCNKTAC
jgi:hypothetical protein